jgi:hypothetical protein
MAERRDGDSGTSGGADLEPLRGGMREVEEGRLGPGRDPAGGRREAGEDAAGVPRRDPAAPYHDTALPEGGLAPRAAAGEGPTPPPSRGELEATAGEQVDRERGDVENEAGNAPRRDPARRDVDQ